MSGVSYRTFDSAENASNIVSAISSTSNGGSVSLDTSGGVFQHDTNGINVEIAGAQFVDATGPDSNSVFTDGTTNVETARPSGYEYVTVYTQRTANAAATVESNGIIGIATLPQDMPTTGTATYNGNAVVRITDATTSTQFGTLSSTVNADFGNGQVDVGIGGFASGAPIDNLSIQDMNISGSRFSGGTIAATDGGAVVDLTGANSTATTAGSFFGYNEAQGAPGEVAGLAVLQGDDGAVQSTFFAD